MLGLSRTVTRACACALGVALVSLLPTRAEAQFGNPFNPFNPVRPIVPIPVPVNPNAIGNQGGGVTRATSSLANPINFYQYGQITGVGPIRGTVRIYNQFGLMEQQNQNQGGLGGLLGGLGGNNNNQLPGQGNTQGDDPPQGVLLHVNYANMFLPNQQQMNQQNQGGFGRAGFGGFGGGLGGFGGGGFGKGYFGNGANGL